MHHTAFVLYSVTHSLMSDPGIFPSAAIVLLGICSDQILSELSYFGCCQAQKLGPEETDELIIVPNSTDVTHMCMPTCN